MLAALLHRDRMRNGSYGPEASVVALPANGKKKCATAPPDLPSLNVLF